MDGDRSRDGLSGWMVTGIGTDSQDGWRQEQGRIIRMDSDRSRDRSRKVKMKR